MRKSGKMNIKRVAVFFKNELFLAFTNIGTYIVALLFLIVPSVYFFFFTHFFVEGSGSADLRIFYLFLPYLSIIVIPVLTMNCWIADFDTIIQLPFSTVEIVVAKWFSSITLILLMQILLLTVPLTVNCFGFVDAGQVFVSNIVLFLFFCSVCAMGQLVSLIMLNNVAAAIITAVFLALTNLIHLLTVRAGLSSKTGSFINYFSFAWHFDSASKGILDSRDVFFYLLQTFVFLSVSAALIEKRKR